MANPPGEEKWRSEIRRNSTKVLSAAPLTLGMVASVPVSAEGASAPPVEPQVESAATESVQPQLDAKAIDQAAEKRKEITAEAVAAVRDTKRALKLLDEKKSEQALAALERATGKLELILARDPGLASAPIGVEVVSYNLLASPETVEAMIRDAEDYLEDGEVQKARGLMDNLASEMVFRTTSIPLATHPEAITAVVPLIDQGKFDEAMAALQVALSTLVVADDGVIPLPVLRAENLLKSAEALADNEERTVKDNEALTEQLAAARNRLKMAEVLGYGSKKSFQPTYRQLDQIEDKVVGGKAGNGWFDKTKHQLSERI